MENPTHLTIEACKAFLQLVAAANTEFDQIEERARMLLELPPPPTNLFLVQIHGDVDPEILGPYANEDERLSAAQAERKDDPERENGLYMLDCEGTPEIDAFAGGDFPDEAEEEES